MVESWLESYRAKGERILKEGGVREIIFSGATYQIDVYDPNTHQHYWPFLQFDEQGRVKDAFCSCQSEHNRCQHLAAAYLAILDSQGQPLHLRFERSFWNHLCRLCADHSGFEEKYLIKKGQGHYIYHNEIYLELKTKSDTGTHALQKMIENRPKETPDNSIKFSTLTQEEINRWREGRPSPDLRYMLSIWSDIAKWMMFHTQEGKVIFTEDQEGFPTLIRVDFPCLSAYFEIKRKDLPRLIPYLDSIDANLTLFPSAEEKIASIRFEPQEETLYLEHASLAIERVSQKKEIDETWVYIPNVGFYPCQRQPLLHRDQIKGELIPFFLENYSHHIAPFIPVHEKPYTLSYSMYFDAEWNWHFHAYLFEKGDLERSGSSLLGSWVFLSGKGFFKIEQPLFDSVVAIVAPGKVSSFVNQHRIWLNSQAGFQTHLASVESQLTYTLTDDFTLRFQSKVEALMQGAESEFYDFGDWIFYRGQGFFSKKTTRLGWPGSFGIYSGLEIKREEISSFIKNHREELEQIPFFFTTTLPLASRGVSVTALSPTSIHVKPLDTLLPGFNRDRVVLFEDYVYLKDVGFCELPHAMRLPAGWMDSRVITQSHFSEFFENELPLLTDHLLHIDPALLAPRQMDLNLYYLTRASGGGLTARFYYHTELGKVAVTELLEALDHKRRYCLTAAGLFDLHRDSYQWLRLHKGRFSPDAHTLQLSTLEFIRLDTIERIFGPPEGGDGVAAITRQLLEELREFRAREKADIRGLKSELRLYQQTGLHWLWFLYKHSLSGLLCDDMGLGKTHQAMALIAAAINDQFKEKKRFLVVCPTSVIYHWQDKLGQFLPEFKVHTFHGLKRTLTRLPKEGIVLTSYGVLRMEQEALSEIPFEIAIFDEVQVAKNPNSRIHEALKKMKARMRLGLTGTPIENNLRELKALFDIVLPGYMPSESRYRELFIQPIERDQDSEKKALLNQLIKPFVLRRRKSEVLPELPEKSENKAYCDLSEEQIFLYQNTLAQSKDNIIARLRDATTPINYIHIFSLLSQLKQICNHPALIHKDPKHFKNYHSGKWDLCMELLDEAQNSDQKVVIFSQYLYMLDIFEHYFQEKGWGYAQIRGDTMNRREELKRFQEDPNCLIFIGSLQAAGLGIDLTAASVVILYDRWWNAARENQAIDRVHRIGQKWGVQVYKLITKNTIEEKIDQMISHKGRLLEEIVTPDDQAIIKKFTRSELLDLLTFHNSS